MAEPVNSVAYSQTTSRRRFSFAKNNKYAPHMLSCSNKKWDPWTCTSKQNAAKIIAIVEFTVNFAHLLPIVITAAKGKIKKDSKADTVISYFVAVIIGLIVMPSVSLILDILLFLGAVQWSKWKCCSYTFGTLILRLSSFIPVARLAAEGMFSKEGIGLIEAIALSTLIFIIVCIYFEIVVCGFMLEISSRNNEVHVIHADQQQSQPDGSASPEIEATNV